MTPARSLTSVSSAMYCVALTAPPAAVTDTGRLRPSNRVEEPDCFDDVIALDEAHVRCLARAYMAYYHAERTHGAVSAARLVPSRPAWS